MMAEVDEKTLESSAQKEEKNDTVSETVPVLQEVEPVVDSSDASPVQGDEEEKEAPAATPTEDSKHPEKKKLTVAENHNAIMAWVTERLHLPNLTNESYQQSHTLAFTEFLIHPTDRCLYAYMNANSDLSIQYIKTTKSRRR